MSPGVMGFDGDDGTASFRTGGALLALPPAPAPRDYQFAFIGENYLTRLRVIHPAFTERCVPLRPIGKMNCDASLQCARVKYCHGEHVANADQIAQVNQQVDTWDVAFLGQAAQQCFGSAAVLGWVHVKAAKSAAPGSQRLKLAQGRSADTLQGRSLFRLVRGLQTVRSWTVYHVLRQDNPAGDGGEAGQCSGIVPKDNHV